MFGRGEKRNNQPIVVNADIDIEVSAEEVFDLLDLASPRCALRERGFLFEAMLADKSRYSATNEDLPGIVFHFEILERTVPSHYVLSSWFESETPLGALEQSHSAYVVRPTGDTTCKVSLTETATLHSGLSKSQRAAEDSMIRLAVVQDLMKLKLHAENGADAVPDTIFDVEDAEFDFDMGFDDGREK